MQNLKKNEQINNVFLSWPFYYEIHCVYPAVWLWASTVSHCPTFSMDKQELTERKDKDSALGFLLTVIHQGREAIVWFFSELWFVIILWNHDIPSFGLVGGDQRDGVRMRREWSWKKILIMFSLGNPLTMLTNTSTKMSWKQNTTDEV